MAASFSNKGNTSNFCSSMFGGTNLDLSALGFVVVASLAPIVDERVPCWNLEPLLREFLSSVGGFSVVERCALAVVLVLLDGTTTVVLMDASKFWFSVFERLLSTGLRDDLVSDLCLELASLLLDGCLLVTVSVTLLPVLRRTSSLVVSLARDANRCPGETTCATGAV